MFSELYLDGWTVIFCGEMAEGRLNRLNV